MTHPDPLSADDPLAIAVTTAIQSGDLDALRRLIVSHPALVNTRIANPTGAARTPVTRAFWRTCRGAQRATAGYLLNQGADAHWVGWDGKTPVRVAAESGDAAFVSWLRSRV